MASAVPTTRAVHHRLRLGLQLKVRDILQKNLYNNQASNEVVSKNYVQLD